MWEVDGQSATCLNNKQIDTILALQDGQSVLDAMVALPKGTPGHIEAPGRFRVEPCAQGRGEHYPRIFRKIVGQELRVSSQNLPRDRNTFVSSMTLTEILFERLDELCRVIHLDAYGHEIRDLLILAPRLRRNGKLY